MFSPQNAVLADVCASITMTSPGSLTSIALNGAARSDASALAVTAVPTKERGSKMGRREADIAPNRPIQSDNAHVTESYDAISSRYRPISSLEGRTTAGMIISISLGEWIVSR
ncbi:hypothetical protein D3C81_2063520 [compost metagenome]